MKNFDKKLLIIFISILIIICVSIYFFTKDEDTNILLSNELYTVDNTDNTNEDLETIMVHIDGEVVTPGIISLKAGARIADAIQACGGTTDISDISKINLAYELKDGQKVYIPSIYDVEDVEYIQNDAGNNVIIPDTSSSSALVNINSATQAELETLPGIGPSTAAKIIDYRNKNGDFKNIEDIMNVSGIGESKFNNIKDYICI